jgi:hypothetical protein
MVYLEMDIMQFKVDEGRVYGARYYTVEPVVDFPLFNVPWYEMIGWVEETFGPSEGSIWFDKNVAPEAGQRWYANNSKFWFRKEEDRSWFILRWQ